MHQPLRAIGCIVFGRSQQRQKGTWFALYELEQIILVLANY